MDQEFKFELADENATIEFGKKLAEISKTGDIFALYGTLGMGKSTLSRAFIQHLTDATDVPSPTFTLLQTYDNSELTIFHYDLYRLKSAEEIFELGIEDAPYQGICLIEWPERMEKYLPYDIFKITLSAKGSGRVLTISVNSKSKADRLKSLENSL